jgi:hypothetical protein
MGMGFIIFAAEGAKRFIGKESESISCSEFTKDCKP